MIHLQLLGTLALKTDGDGGPSDMLVHAKRVALLSYLALAHPHGFHRRDRLYALLWPDADTERARNSLRQAVHQLRQSLGADVIRSRGDEEIGLAPDALTCDAAELERAAAEGRHADAVALYAGELLSGFHVANARDFSDWLDGERERLSDLATDAAWKLAEDHARTGAPAEAARVARTAVSWRPFNETSNRRLIELLDRLGDTAGALRAYDAFAERLRAELETAPSQATTAVVRAIRARSPVLPPPPDWAVPVVPEATGGRRGRRWRPGVFYAAGLLTVLAIAAALQGGRRASAARVDPSRVTVFPFSVHGSADLSYLGDGMVDLLSAKLEGAAGFHAIDPHSVIAAVAFRADTTAPDLASYERIARQLGSGRFIVGNVVQAGSGIQLSAGLYDDGRPVTTASVTGSAAELLDLVDGLTGRLLAGLTPGRDTMLARLAALTTHSLPALKAFLEGEQALRAGRDGQAAESFREAAAIDTGFALAHYRMAVMATWVSSRDVPDPAQRAAAAARHAQRLTPLVRDLLNGYQAYKEVRVDDAERIYQSVTDAHPDNVEAWFMLGETRFHYNPLRGRPAMSAWAAFRRVLALDPSNAHAAIHLARLAVQEGRLAELDTLAADYLARFKDAERALEMRALVAYARNDTVARREIAALVREADEVPAASLMIAATQYAQNLDAAAELAPRFAGAGSGPTLVYGRRTAQDLPLARGQISRALPDNDWLLESQALFAAEPMNPVPASWVRDVRSRIAARRTYPVLGPFPLQGDPRFGLLMQHYLLGLLSVRLGDTVAATRAIAELSARSAAGAALAIGVRAELERTRGNFRAALQDLEHFALDSAARFVQRPLHWGLRERFLRGELLHALGRDAEALPWYQSMQGGYETIYLAPAQLRQAEIEQRMGHAERAAFHYGRFLSMWKDADLAFQPLVDSARVELRKISAPK